MNNSDTENNTAGNMKKITITYVMFLAMLIVALPVSSKTVDGYTGAASTGFQFLEEPVNPAAVAMGSANTAGRGQGFAFYNPALPALDRSTFCTIVYGQQTGDLTHFSGETVIHVKNGFFGIALRSETIDDIYPTSFDGKVSPNAASAQQTGLSIGAGFRMPSSFGLGISLTGTQDRILTYPAYAITGNIGVVYTILPGRLDAGFSIVNVGTSTSYLDTVLNIENIRNESELPVNVRAGARYADTLGAVACVAAADITYRKADKRVMVPVGIDVRPVSQFALRLGKRFNHDTELFSIGCGLDLSPVSFSCSFVPMRIVGDPALKWMVSITYTLKSQATKLLDKKENQSAAKPVEIKKDPVQEKVPPLTPPVEDETVILPQ
jgi:hypothetical protein